MSDEQTAYRVLARKYRPADFDGLIGQDALVRTLQNAIASNRIAHAFMLTGVRGVGKTTTARIIAKALNYTGPDGLAGPTTGPTDDCAICQSIAEGRHPDVMEMDAASRTGVDDIREILDGVRYAPVSARYKIYIIDEVHMLSKGAFNALLKTLEEPPPHVKFIFATTEIRKVPVTVLSRCQRFDLRRVEIPVLEAHYTKLCGLENVACEEEAITMIARAADGSVRDGLSLLDQAMALGVEGGVTASLVQTMLGLADRGRILDLLDYAFKGEAAEALAVMGDLHRLGADAGVIINDLLELTHLVTRLRVAPQTRDMPVGLSPDGVERALEMAGRISMPSLGRAWQILLKGAGEVLSAPNPYAAAEMVVIRLIYASGLPDPADLLRRLQAQEGAEGKSGGNSQGADTPARSPEPVALRAVAGGGGQHAPMAQPVGQPEYGIDNRADATPEPQAEIALTGLQDVVTLLEDNREVLLANHLYQYAHLVRFQDGLIEMRIDPHATPKLAQDVGRILSSLTQRRWMVTVSGATGAPTLAETARQKYEIRLEEARKNPLVAEVLRLFPDAKLDINPVTE